MNDDPTSDDFNTGDEAWLRLPPGQRRMVVELEFAEADAVWICDRAEALGMRLTEFVRRAALEKADANRVIVRIAP